MSGRCRGGFARTGAIRRELEPVGRVAPVDRVDRLEHRHVKHRLTAGVWRVRKLLPDSNGVGLGVPVHDDVATGGGGKKDNGEQCGDGRN